MVKLLSQVRTGEAWNLRTNVELENSMEKRSGRSPGELDGSDIFTELRIEGNLR